MSEAEPNESYRALAWEFSEFDGEVGISQSGPDRFRVTFLKGVDDTKYRCYIAERAYKPALKQGSRYYEIGKYFTLDDAKKDIEDYDFHLFQVRSFGRHEDPYDPLRSEPSPWGRAENFNHYAPGLTFISTPSHGGFRVSAELNETFPEHLRVSVSDGKFAWYEEDCEFSKVIVALPDLFSDREKREACKALKHWYPESWKTHVAQPRQEGVARIVDDRRFRSGVAPDGG